MPLMECTSTSVANATSLTMGFLILFRTPTTRRIRVSSAAEPSGVEADGMIATSKQDQMQNGHACSDSEMRTVEGDGTKLRLFEARRGDVNGRGGLHCRQCKLLMSRYLDRAGLQLVIPVMRPAVF